MKSTGSQKIKNNHYIAKAVLPFVVVLLLQVIISLVLETAEVGETVIYAVTGIVLPVILILILIHIYKRNYQLSDAEKVPADVAIKGTLLGCIAVFFMQIAVGTMVDILSVLFNFNIEASGNNLSDFSGITGLVIVFVASVILGPILEEYLYRGLMFDCLKRRFGFMVAAIVSSLIWGVMHLDLTTAVVMFGVGMILAYIYNAFRNIGICIAIHMINNGIAFAASISSSGIQNAESAAPGILSSCIMLAIAVLILIWTFRKMGSLKSEFETAIINENRILIP